MHPEEAAAYGPVDEQAAVRLRLADGRVMFGRVDQWRHHDGRPGRPGRARRWRRSCATSAPRATAARACDEARRARGGVRRLRRRPSGAPAPDRLRDLRRLAPRRRPAPDRADQAVRRVAAGVRQGHRGRLRPPDHGARQHRRAPAAVAARTRHRRAAGAGRGPGPRRGGALGALRRPPGPAGDAAQGDRAAALARSCRSPRPPASSASPRARSRATRRGGSRRCEAALGSSARQAQPRRWRLSRARPRRRTGRRTSGPTSAWRSRRRRWR